MKAVKHIYESSKIVIFQLKKNFSKIIGGAEAPQHPQLRGPCKVLSNHWIAVLYLQWCYALE